MDILEEVRELANGRHRAVLVKIRETEPGLSNPEKMEPSAYAVRRIYRTREELLDAVGYCRLLREKYMKAARILEINEEERTVYYTFLPGRNALEYLNLEEQTEKEADFVRLMIWSRLADWMMDMYERTGFLMKYPDLRSFIFEEETDAVACIAFEGERTSDAAEGFGNLLTTIRMTEPVNTEAKLQVTDVMRGCFLGDCDVDENELLNAEDRYENEIMKIRKNRKKYIDLHAHLDGAITVDILKKLAELQNLPLPASDDRDLEKMISLPPDSVDLNDFLKCFELPVRYLQTETGICEAVRLVLESMAEDGVIYAEIRFAPQLSTEKGLTQRDVIRAAVEGLREAPIPANLILCCMRGASVEKNLETVELAREFLVDDGGVTALDLAGAEGLFPTEDYRELFAKARDYGIPFTLHAGEAAGPESVRCAIEMGAVRIGHGIRAAQDPDVMRLIREKNITLEMAPTSNRQTHAVEDMADYPIRTFLENGIKVTINTDDPAIERTTLSEEFCYVEVTFGITPDEEKNMLVNAAEAAFASPARREELRRQFLT